MTLLDAPEFDEAHEHRRLVVFYSTAGLLFVLFAGFWLAAGRPVDYPWYWNSHLRGRMAVNSFLGAVEKNDLPAAYGIWIHDKNWQQHPAAQQTYTYGRFQQDWSPHSPDNEYGSIQSHRIVEATMHGNVLLMAIYINGRKSKALDLDYDPTAHTLNFSPEDVQLYLGP